MLGIFTKKIWQVLFLISTVACLYWPACQFDFLYGWDDQWFVTNNYTEGGLGWKNFYSILTNFYYGQYAPLNQLYYTTIFTFFGYNTAVYHIAGICVHSINVLLVYFLMELTIPNVQNETFAPHNVISFMTAVL